MRCHDCHHCHDCSRPCTHSKFQIPDCGVRPAADDIIGAMNRLLVFLFALLIPLTGAAQDTQTEKEAARDVMKKMAALEQSLDVPAIVARLTGPNAERDQVVARVKELMDKELLAMADDIATHPEIGFEEKRSVSKITDYLPQHNFTAETGSGGLATAVLATFKHDHGSPPRPATVE